MAIIVILCGAPHLYKKDMNNSGLVYYKNYIKSLFLMIFSSNRDYLLFINHCFFYYEI